jgi:demethylmenaquinone methyltransferase / 2-methoxy-6-polyprenyl-1,4-benzoquinol methylase
MTDKSAAVESDTPTIGMMVAEASGTPNSAKVQGIFPRIAPGYDRFNHLASLGIDRSWRKATVSAAALTPQSSVLDIASGTGDLALALAKQGRPAEVLATDFVPEMLEIAHHKAQRYEGPTKIEFQVADAQSLPIPDQTFDAATVAFGVRNFPNRMANFCEVHRVLKPGGRYVVLEFSQPPNRLFAGFYHFYLRHVIPNIGALVAGDKPSFVYLNDSIRAFPDQEALSSELRCAGFSDVSYTNRTGGIVAIHVAVK